MYLLFQEKLVERLDRKANGSLRLNKPKNELPPEPRDVGVEQQVRIVPDVIQMLPLPMK